jgi:hypothetical protein
MGWSDAPPTKDELITATAPKAAGSWADAPPTKEELGGEALAVGSKDNPFEKDLFGSDSDRAKSSFGDTKGVGKLLLQKGFVDVAKNKDGDIVAKDKDGNWHKDASGFLSHPINWAESHAGQALPLAGGIGAATLASASGPGAILAAGAGGAGGEAARIAAGKAMGVYDGDLGDAATDVGENAAGMALGEGAGRYVLSPIAKAIAPYAAPVTDMIGQGLKKGIARASEITSGAPREAVERLIERPNEVLGATPDKAIDVAEKARAELLQRNNLEGQKISAAREQFGQTHGEMPIDTSDVLDENSKFLAKKNPIYGEQGAISVDEAESLSGLKNRLTTDGGPFKTAKSLQNFADYLGTEVKRFDQSKLPGSGDTPYQSQLRRMYGQVKDLLHKVDPEGLGSADKRFSEFATDADRLGKLENPDQMEGFVNNYYGKNKSLMRESADKLLPQSTEDIADLGANKAFSSVGPAGSHAGLRNMVSIGLGAEGAREHNPYMMAAGGLLQPQVQKQMIGQGARALQALGSAPWFQAILRNPKLAQSIASPELRGMVDKSLEAIQGGFSKSASSGGDGRDQAHYDPGTERASSLEDAKNKFLEGN